MNTKNMMNKMASYMQNQMFRREDCAAIDMFTGKVCVKKANGTSITYELVGEETQAVQIVENVIDMSMAIPAYSMKIAIDQVKVGDVYMAERGPIGFVEKVNTTSVAVRKFDGSVSTYTPPKVSTNMGLVPQNSVRVLRSLFNFGATEAEGQNFLGSLQSNPMLAMLMFRDDEDKESKFDDLMPLLLMGGLNGGQQANGAMNPMVMMMLLKNQDLF